MARRRRWPLMSMWAAESDRDYDLMCGNDPEDGAMPRPRPRCRWCNRLMGRPETEAARACIPPCPEQLAASRRTA